METVPSKPLNLKRNRSLPDNRASGYFPATRSADAPPATEYRVRVARPEDADALLALGRKLLGETDFFLRRPQERAGTTLEMRRIIDRYAAMPGGVMLNAWDQDTPVAEAVLSAGALERTAHVGVLGIGVLKAYWGLGIGRALMTALEDAARDAVLERLEFTVLAHNRRARGFYAALGYAEEGIRRRSVRFDAARPGEPARYGDEVMMAKWIGPADCMPMTADR
jgi:RimJ/RimL family protein N-acetyltransferase